MTALFKVTRRRFLVATTSGGVGLVLGFYAWNAIETEKREGRSGGFSPNVWLQISPDNRVNIWIAKSEMGQGVQTSLAMLVAEELEADWSSIHVRHAAVGAEYGLERTEGSTSVRTSWDTLRHAGAAAREMLLTAAANAWGVDESTCQARDGKILHIPTGRQLPYGDLAIAASRLPVPKDAPLKNPRDFRFLGKPMPRVDVESKVDGSAMFGIDVKLPGMLYANVARCPNLAGKLKRFDAAQAKASPGVLEVRQISSGVAVIADSTWNAFRGRQALDIEWDPGALSNFSDSSIQQSLADGAGKSGLTARNDGDVDSAMAAAAKRVTATYNLPYLAHTAMEPLNCTAHVRWNRCEIWCSTQTPETVQRRAARVAFLPPFLVDVHTTLIGGGFGRRLENDMVADAVELSKATGKPVQVVWTREDDTQHDFYRPAAHSEFTAGLDAAGILTVWKHQIVAQSIDARFESLEGTPDTTSVQGANDLPYEIPNIRVTYFAPQIPVPVGYWRSVGYSLNAFVTECFLDEVAAECGKDPVALRRELLRNSPRRAAVLNLAAEKGDWGKPMLRGEGRGIALHTSYGSSVAQVAEVGVEKDGTIRVHRVVCAIDCGQIVNPDTIAAQMEGGIVFGLSAALWGKISFKDGKVQQSNFDDIRVLRMPEMPRVEVYIVPSTEPPTGVGEVGVPPVAPAVANAVFAATGKRLRDLPIESSA